MKGVLVSQKDLKRSKQQLILYIGWIQLVTCLELGGNAKGIGKSIPFWQEENIKKTTGCIYIICLCISAPLPQGIACLIKDHHPIIPKFNKADWGGTLFIPMINQQSLMDTRLIIIPI